MLTVSHGGTPYTIEAQQHNCISAHRVHDLHITMGSVTSGSSDQVVSFIPPSKSKEGQRRLVLTEEEYQTQLSSIVSRDYFPDVAKLERENALLDRRLNNDALGAVAVRRETRRLIESENFASARRERDEHDLVGQGGLAAGEQNKVIAVRGTGGGKLIRKRPRPLNEESVSTSRKLSKSVELTMKEFSKNES